MRRSETLPPKACLPLVLLVGTLLFLHACQDVTDPQDPRFATTGDKQLVISARGIGSGTVTVPATAGRLAINCVITAGVAAEGKACSRYYPYNTVVTLTAIPAGGSTFAGWSGACTGTGTCTVTMTLLRRVTAKFDGPAQAFQLVVTGGGGGDGSVGTVGAPEGIACTITDGEASATGCTAQYAPQAVVTLEATPAGDHSFVGWQGDCVAAGSAATCEITMSQARNVIVVFNDPGVVAPEATLGKWDLPFLTPVIAVHLVLMPDRKVLLWGESGQPWVWDPSTYPADPASGFTEVPTPVELFCSGHTFLADQRLLVTGGQDPLLGHDHGIPDVNLFSGGAWSAEAAMALGRWYPTATTMGDGKVVVLAGGDNTSARVLIPELYDGGVWHQLTGASLSMNYYPRAFVEPKLGRLFYAGEDFKTRYLDPAANGGTGAWTTVGNRKVASRGYGSAVMLDGKVLYMGGGGGACPNLVTNTAEIIDLNAGIPAWRLVGAMARPRRQLNATILPDGKVLVTGGTSACGFNDASGAEYSAEVWDPTTEQWSTVASNRVKRLYHSTAILMPDARVLVSGSGLALQHNAEYFTPPSLFKSDGTLAARPSYTLSSTQLAYDQAVTVQTPDASTIAKVTLVRLSAATHSFNQSQQFNTLSFTGNGGSPTITVTTPASGTIAPPGPYMLFLIDDKGVPSHAQIVSLR
jgi:Domain of unknown function (DUF1929)/Divergent InlB B-repeat domain/Kelch motif